MSSRLVKRQEGSLSQSGDYELEYEYNDISSMLDHALLNPSLSSDELDRGCQLAVEYNVASVCILPYYVRQCAQILRGSPVNPSTTIGFPHGAVCTAPKRAEAEQAIADGCRELDMVVNVSQVISERWVYVHDDIQAVVDVAHAAGKKIKVIFENCYLNRKQKLKLCQVCSVLRADWVKTSTGFGTSGATIDDLKLMVDNTPQEVEVKASGGVRDLDALLEVRALGVTRVGSSRTREILDECRRRLPN